MATVTIGPSTPLLLTTSPRVVLQWPDGTCRTIDETARMIYGDAFPHWGLSIVDASEYHARWMLRQRLAVHDAFFDADKRRWEAMEPEPPLTRGG